MSKNRSERFNDDILSFVNKMLPDRKEILSIVIEAKVTDATKLSVYSRSHHKDDSYLHRDSDILLLELIRKYGYCDKLIQYLKIETNYADRPQVTITYTVV